MLPPITEKYSDLSARTYFLFRFMCDCCGEYWESEKYPFSQRDAVPKTEDEKYAHDLIWMSEHEAAYERANNEAVLHFNRCKKCARRVCDKCFAELEDFCLECANKGQTREGERK